MLKHGFTLVELLVAIVIIGILSSISVSTFTGYREQARLAKAQSFESQAVRKLNLDALQEGLGATFWLNFDEGGLLFPDFLGSNFIYPSQEFRFDSITDTPSGSGLAIDINAGFGTSGFTHTLDTFVPQDEFTIAAWIKPESNAGTLNNFARVIGRPPFGGSRAVFMATTGQTGVLSFQIDTATIQSQPDTVRYDEWQYVVASYDGTTMRLYRNGDLVASQPATTLTNINRINFFNTNNGGSIYRGGFDEMRLYPVAFTGL